MKRHAPAVLCVLILLAGFGFWFYVHTQKSRETAALNALRDAGYPTTAAELAEAWPMPPTEENGAGFYGQAINEMIELQTAYANKDENIPLVGQAEMPEPGEPMSPEMRDAIAAYLDAAAPAFQWLDNGLDYPNTQFIADFSAGINIELPHLARIRQGARLYALQSSDRLEAGDIDGAVESAIRARRVGNALAREPILISQLVRHSCAIIAFDATERLLHSDRVTREHLDALAAVWNEPADGSMLRTAWQGEIVMNLTLSDTEIVNMFGEADLPKALRYPYYAPIASADRAMVAGMYRGLLQATELPLPEMRAAAYALADQADDTPSRYLRTHSVPAVTRAAGGYQRYRAYHDLLLTALAVERYRRDHNAIPETLDALVPGYAASVPTDPYTAEPLQYRLRDTGYLLYSVADDQQDNGGIPRATVQSGEPWDIPLRIRR